MKVTGKTIIDSTAAGNPRLSPEVIAQFGDRGLTRTYQCLNADPLPRWLFDAIVKWYGKNGPIKPPVVNEAFQYYVLEARERLTPEIPFAIAAKPAKRSSPKKNDDDDDGPRGGRPKAKEEVQAHVGPNPPSIEERKAESGEAASRQSIAPEPEPAPLPRNWDDAFACIARLARLKPVPRERMAALYAHIRNQPWACDENGVALSPGAIRVKFRRATGISSRRRQRPVSTARRDVAICQVLSGCISQHRKDSHDKGAGEYSLGSLRAIIKGVMGAPETKRLLDEHTDIRGQLPSDSRIEAILREHRGGSDRTAECQDHLEKTIGFRAEYAGQVAMVDSTGWPVRFISGTESKKHKEQIFLCCDVASAHIRAANLSATSESEGWRPKENPERRDVMMLFLREMQFFPEWLVNDAISTLTDGLRDLHPNKHPAERLSTGVLLWLAGGVRPYVRMSGRPTGGAHVERAVNTTKDKLAELGTKRAVSLESKGLGLRKLYEIGHRLEFLEVLQRAVAEVNAAPLKRRGCPFSRAELHSKESAIARRAQRAAAPDLFQPGENGIPKWQRIVSAAKTGVVMAGRVSVKINGEAWAAELVEPDGGWRCKPEEKFALVLPPSARKDDDPETFRVIVIETDKAGVQYHASIAKSVKVDEYWQDTSKPIIGQFQKKPDVATDALARQRDLDAQRYRRDVAALKEGTTGEPIADGGFPRIRE
jgi:hypothetical protein